MTRREAGKKVCVRRAAWTARRVPSPTGAGYASEGEAAIAGSPYRGGGELAGEAPAPSLGAAGAEFGFSSRGSEPAGGIAGTGGVGGAESSATILPARLLLIAQAE